MAYIEQFEDIRHLLQRADYTDVKVVEGSVSLREFIASMLSYYPRWVIGLYRIRAVFCPPSGDAAGVYRYAPCAEARGCAF